MNSALYYPYMRLDNADLLKTALLLWDRIEVINPYGGRPDSSDNAVREAQELVVSSHQPTPEELQHADALVRDLVTRPLPKWLLWDVERPSDYISARKFLPDTWRTLEEARFINDTGCEGDFFRTNEVMGLMLMAILADCCAGETKVKVTDEGVAYRSLARFLAVEDGTVTVERPRPEDEVLVTVVYKTLDLTHVSLPDLVRLRRREHDSGGEAYVGMRQRLRQTFEEHAVAMVTQSFTPSDRVECERIFEEGVERDFADLAHELGLVGHDFLFSKAFAGLVLIVAGSIAEPGLSVSLAAHGGLALSGAGLLDGLFRKYRAQRRKLLKEHPSAYLYLAKNSQFERDFRLV